MIYSTLLMKFVMHSTGPHLEAEAVSHLTCSQSDSSTRTKPRDLWGAVWWLRQQYSFSPDLILSVWVDKRITISLPPIVMRMIKRWNYTGRRIWFIENVLSCSPSGLIILFRWGGREREGEGNLQVCFFKKGFFSFHFKGLHWVSPWLISMVCISSVCASELPSEDIEH